MNTSILDRT